MKEIVISEAQLEEVAKKLLSGFPAARIFAFHGEMGAGKTTFIKVICRQLGVKDTMSSPTFSIVNEYRDASNNPVFHFDFYRLNSEREAEDAGLHEYFFNDAYCFVEWPEKAPGLLPDGTIHVFIQLVDGKRVISAKDASD